MIGIMDSGLGGIVTMNHVLKTFTDTSFVCLADQANAPYGDKSFEELEILARRNLKWFQKKGITTVLVACNTLCSTVIPKMKAEFADMQIIDIVSLTCESLEKASFTNILLLATKMSVQTKVYENKIKAMFPQSTIYPVVPSKWVPCVENNASEEELWSVVHEYVDAYRGKVDAVLLGCTHYPLLADKIATILPVKIYDSCDAVLKSLSHEHDSHPLVEIYTSADPVKTKKQIQDLLNLNVKVYKQ